MNVADMIGFEYASISARALFLASSNDEIVLSLITGQSKIQSPPASAFIVAIDVGEVTRTRIA
jgi:hypothetical protein